MKINREQYDEICEDDGNFYIDDFPISSNQDIMFELFTNLPSHEKSLAIEWGFNDTVFRDNVFVILCKSQLGMTCKEYYSSKEFKNYMDNGELIELDFNKIK